MEEVAYIGRGRLLNAAEADVGPTSTAIKC